MLAGLFAAWVVNRMAGGPFDEGPEGVHFKPTDTGPGRKFGIDGSVQRFPGNTILCHLSHSGPQFDALKVAVAGLREKTGEGNIVWLPPSSYHMTVFDGSLDSRRQRGDWPEALSREASLEECNAFFAERLHAFDLGFDPPIRMVPDENQNAPTQTCIPLRPVDAEEAARLRKLRDRLSGALGIRHANHDAYTFHMSFGYYVRAFDPVVEREYRANLRDMIRKLRQAWPVIELGPPEYCLFDDMTLFRTQFHLGRNDHR